MDRIGIIGVGLMGHGIAGRLLAAGHPLTVMGHRNRKPVEDLVGRGAREATSARALAEASDVVILVVTGSAQVEDLAFGPDGLMAAARPGGAPLTIVDCSTSDPVSTRKVAAALAEAGIDFADAPMGGTPVQAEAGELSLMVGAKPSVLDRLRPVLDRIASRIVPTGEVGTGHTMKLLNNFLSLGYAAIYAEALTVGRKAGIDVATFDSVIRGSRMDCGFYRTFMGYALERDPNAHRFTIRNALKDLTYLESLALSEGVANPLGNAARNLYAMAAGTGRGDAFVPTVADFVAEHAGTRLLDADPAN